MKQLYYAIQTILHGRGSNITKIISLSLGLTIGILLFSQIAYEMNYEKCYPEPERLALVRGGGENVKTGEKTQWYDKTLYAPMSAAIRDDLPKEVENATTIFNFETYNVFKDDKKLRDANYGYVDTCFFRTMGIDVLKGNPQDLQTPNNVFVSESFANEIFAGGNPIGQTLSLDKKQEITIRGIYRDLPENTQFGFDFVVSIYNQGGYVGNGSWRGNDIYYTILRLQPNVSRTQINNSLDKAMEKYIPSENSDWVSFYDAIPLVDVHLDDSNTRTRLMIYAFLGFAIFFVAIMNYILISVATLSRRAKMVGVHKCNGANTRNIFSMFLIETGLIVLVSVLISLFIIHNSSDLIEDLLSVRVSSLFTWDTLWVPLLTIFILFIIAGVLPGRLFSRIPVTQVFHRYTDGKKGWKRFLLLVQFTGVSFVMGMLLVSLMQYTHLMNKDMGIRPHGLVTAQTWMTPEEAGHLSEDILRQPMVENVSLSINNVIGQYWTQGLINNSGERIATLNYNICDDNYVKTMGITIVEGTDMKNHYDVLVNEELVRQMKWTDGAVGKRLNEFDKAGPIVGVIRDIRNFTFNGPQAPIALLCSPNPPHCFNVRLKEPYEDNKRRLNEYMEKTYPAISLDFTLIDDMLKEAYSSTYRFRNSVLITSCFILLIVIMGLIGYVNDETQRRSKEIAIRKVNGAEASNILRLLTRDILFISIPSVLAGATISFFTGKEWLNQFAEQIGLNPLFFIGMALIVITIIIVSVVIRAWRIANENPVNSIKSE